MMKTNLRNCLIFALVICMIAGLANPITAEAAVKTMVQEEATVTADNGTIAEASTAMTKATAAKALEKAVAAKAVEKAVTGKENEVTRIIVSKFDSKPAKNWPEGVKLTDKRIAQLGIKVEGKTKKGLIPLPTLVKEKGQYLKSDKNGKVQITIYYGNLKKVKTIKLGIKPTKIVVKQKSSLYEGQKITEDTLKDALNVTVKYSNGTKTKSFKGYSVSQLNKYVKKGQKLTIKVGKLSKKLNCKVNSIKRIFITDTEYQEWPGGVAFDPKAFPKKNTVKAEYTDGKQKKINNYKVTSSLKNGEMTVKVVYGTKSDKIVLPVRYNISVSKTAGEGTVSVSQKTAKYNTKVKLVAKPANGFKFDGWYSNGKKLSTAETYQPVIKKSQTFEGKFEPIMCNIEMTQEGKGKVSSEGITDGKITFGETATFVAEPEEGYDFLGWYIAGNQVSEDKILKLTVKEDITINAVFVKQKVHFSTKINGQGDIEILSGEEEVEEGTEIIVKAVPKEHHEFSGWTINGEPAGNESILKHCVFQDTEIEAKFVPKNYDLKLESNGSIKVNGTLLQQGKVMKIPYGQRVLIEGINTDAKKMKFLLKDGVSLTGPFKMEGNTNITAFFETYHKAEINAQQLKAGKIEIDDSLSQSSEQYILAGKLFVATAVPAEGEIFQAWVDRDGEIITTNRTLTIKMEEDIYVEARFSTKYHSVKVKGRVQYNATVLQDDEIQVRHGEAIQLFPVDEGNEKFEDWNVTVPHKVEENNSLNVVVTDDVTIEASYSKWYQVQLDNDQLEAGLISVFPTYENIPNQEVKEGEKFSVIANPPKGYEFDFWTDETGAKIGNEQELIIEVQKNIKVLANFKQKEYEVKASKEGKGSIQVRIEECPNATVIVAGDALKLQPKAGQHVVLEATPEENWELEGWSLEGKIISRAPVLTREIWQDEHVIAIMKPRQVEVNVICTGNGDLKINGKDTKNLKVPAGSKVQFEYQPGPQEVFQGWTTGKETITSTTFTKVVDENITVKCSTKIKEYTVTIISNGTVKVADKEVTGEAKIKYPYGTNIRVIPYNTEHLRFGYYKIDNQQVAGEELNIRVEEDLQLEAVFGEVFSVNILTNQPGGTVNVENWEPDQPLCSKEQIIALEAIPKRHYEFCYWLDQNARVISTDPKMELSVVRDIIITPIFKLRKYTVNAQLQGEGFVLIDGEEAFSKEVLAETYVNLTARPKPHWQFEGWYDKENNLVSQNQQIKMFAEEDLNITAHFERKSYNFKVVKEGEGKVFVNSQEFVEDNFLSETKLTLSEEPETNSLFIGWYEDDKLVSDQEELQLTLEKSRELKAKFAQKTCLITVVGGSIEGTEMLSKEFPVGTKVKVVAESSTYSRFKAWEDEEGNVISTDLEYEFVVENEKTLTARYEKYHDLNVVSPFGTIFVDNNEFTETVVKEGSHVLKVVPQEGYQIVSWKDEKGNELSKEDEIKLDIKKATTLVVDYERVTYRIKVENKTGLNNVTIDEDFVSSKLVPLGETVKLTAHDSKYFKFNAWIDKKTGEIVSRDKELFLTVEEEVTLTAEFSQYYDLTVKAVESGKATLGKQEIAGKTLTLLKGNYTITATAAEGHEFIKWVDGQGNEIGTNASLEISLTNHMVIEPIFRRKTHLVTVSSIGNVTINGELVSSKQIVDGSMVILEAEETDNLRFKSFKDKDENILSENPKYAFSVKTDTEIFVEYEEIYQLTVLSSNGGTVLMEGKDVTGTTQELTKGNYVLSANPDDGYELEGWFIEGQLIGSEEQIEISLEQNQTIQLKFRKKEHAISIRLSNNAIDGDVLVKCNGKRLDFVDGIATECFEHGTSVTLKATGSSQYFFSKFNDAGNNITEDTYSFVVEENKTVNVVFENSQKLTVERKGGPGKVTLDGQLLGFASNVAEENLLPGNHTLEAISNDDYEFLNWTEKETNKILSSNPRYTLSLTEDTTVVANFREKTKTVNVIFKHENGQVLLSQAVAFGEAVTPPTNVQHPSKVFTGWKINEKLFKISDDATFVAEDGETLEDAIKSLTAGKKDVIIISNYEEKAKETFEVTLTNCTIERYDGKVEETENKYRVEQGTHLYLLAEEPAEGMQFSHIEVNGELASSYSNYDLRIESNTTIEAVYVPEEEEVIQEPIVKFYGPKYSDDRTQRMISMYMACEIPEPYDKLEWGILMTTKTEDVVSDAELQNVNGPGTKKADTLEDTKNAPFCEFTYSYVFKTDSNWVNQVTVRACVYAILDSPEGSKIIYSEVIHMPLGV